jgi:hypothetical protein
LRSGPNWGRRAAASTYPAYASISPPTYFWQALVCLFLFLPTGLAAVAYSILVTKRAQGGDNPGAVRASYLARLWCLWSIVAFVVAIVVYAVTGIKS